MKRNYGEIIKQERIRQGLSQKELATMANLPISSIWYSEQSGNTVFLSVADKIFDALGIFLTIGKRPQGE